MERHVVTGAFGYSGRFIAERLLEAGHEVATLTNSTKRPSPLAERVQVFPLDFAQPEKLTEALRGASVLYNTYWVRFNHKNFTHAQAVENTMKLFEAAKAAGVRRIVHTSITNPSEESPLEYFSGKARLERALRESGLSYAILRPAVLFGGEDILINNIAWVLRKSPVFGVFGDGKYRIQPIHVEDFARLAVEQGVLNENAVINAIGPETFTYKALVQKLGEIIDCERPIISVSPWLGSLVGAAVGAAMGDVTITRDEIEGLMGDLLYVDAPPAGATRLTEWARANSQTLGMRYANELARRR